MAGVLITKIIKGGFGRKINSEFGYASFEIMPDSVEVVVDPPVDLTTEEGKGLYEKLQKNLRNLMMKQLEGDTDLYRSRNAELDLSLKAQYKKVQKAKAEEN